MWLPSPFCHIDVQTQHQNVLNASEEVPPTKRNQRGANFNEGIHCSRSLKPRFGRRRRNQLDAAGGAVTNRNGSAAGQEPDGGLGSTRRRLLGIDAAHVSSRGEHDRGSGRADLRPAAVRRSVLHAEVLAAGEASAAGRETQRHLQTPEPSGRRGAVAHQVHGGDDTRRRRRLPESAVHTVGPCSERLIEDLLDLFLGSF